LHAGVGFELEFFWCEPVFCERVADELVVLGLKLLFAEYIIDANRDSFAKK